MNTICLVFHLDEIARRDANAPCRLGAVRWIPIVPFVGWSDIAAVYSPCGDYNDFCCILAVSVRASLVPVLFCCTFLAICVELSDISASSR